VPRIKLLARIDRTEQSLNWQGANPKELDFAELRDHLREPDHEADPIENKYRARIRNRATSIRAYCVSCQGGYVQGVRDCVEVVCPLYSFRMGADPLRGFKMPEPAHVFLTQLTADDE